MAQKLQFNMMPYPSITLEEYLERYHDIKASVILDSVEFYIREGENVYECRKRLEEAVLKYLEFTRKQEQEEAMKQNEFYLDSAWPAMVKEIRRNPEDDTLKLAAADFIEERGNSVRAELIRTGVRLDTLPKVKQIQALTIERLVRVNDGPELYRFRDIDPAVPWKPAVWHGLQFNGKMIFEVSVPLDKEGKDIKQGDVIVVVWRGARWADYERLSYSGRPISQEVRRSLTELPRDASNGPLIGSSFFQVTGTAPDFVNARMLLVGIMAVPDPEPVEMKMMKNALGEKEKELLKTLKTWHPYHLSNPDLGNRNQILVNTKNVTLWHKGFPTTLATDQEWWEDYGHVANQQEPIEEVILKVENQDTNLYVSVERFDRILDGRVTRGWNYTTTGEMTRHASSVSSSHTNYSLALNEIFQMLWGKDIHFSVQSSYDFFRTRGPHIRGEHLTDNSAELLRPYSNNPCAEIELPPDPEETESDNANTD